MMKFDNTTYYAGWVAFWLLAIIVTWNWLAPGSWHFLTENNRKLLGIVGLLIYVWLAWERHRRREDDD